MSKAMSNEQLAVSSEQGGGVRSFRYSCFHQHSYFRLANIQPFPKSPTPRRFSFPPLIRYTATSLLIAHCSLLIASHRYTATSLLIAHCSLLIASHRYTATSLLIAHCSLLIASHRYLTAHCSLLIAHCIAIACRQYYKKKSALSPITTFPLWESA